MFNILQFKLRNHECEFNYNQSVFFFKYMCIHFTRCSNTTKAYTEMVLIIICVRSVSSERLVQ